MEKDLKLNILMCCHLPLRATLGGAKVYIEAAQAYRILGHSVDLVGIDEIVGTDQPFMDENWRVLNFPKKLHLYIGLNAHRYDVIEYESIYLPFPKVTFIKSILVARSVLLDLHLRDVKIPHFKGFRAYAGLLLKSWQRNARLNLKITQSLKSMSYADRINVPNPADKKILIRYGIDPAKIIVQPYGLFQKRLDQFKNNNFKNNNSKKKIIAFVGTFDNRKGAVEFPLIIRSILETHPTAEFKLLGVLGMFPSEESIYRYIGEEFRSRVHIKGQYSPDELPDLLQECSYGIFPSYLESFGFGVLEMMANNLPVVGYDSPGINMLLLEELIVSPGKVKDLLAVFSRLFNDEQFSQNCVLKCKEKVSHFIYETQENLAVENYQKTLKGWSS